MEQKREQVAVGGNGRRAITADKVSFIAIFFGVVLLPLFVLPMFNLSSDIVKSALLFTLVAVSFLAWLIARLMDGKIVFPGSGLLLALMLVPVAFLISALFSVVPKISLWGVQYETGTFLTVAMLALAGFLVAIFFQTRERIFSLYAGFVGGSFLAFLFLVIGFLTARGILPTASFSFLPANIVGKWSDLAAFFGFAGIISFTTLDFIPLRKQIKIVAIVSLTLSLLVLILVNSSLVWTVIGAISFIAFVYTISFRQNTPEEKHGARKFPVFSFGVLLISMVFVLAGSPINNLLQNSLRTNIPQEVVRPSWQTTMILAKASFKQNPLLGIGPNRFVNAWASYRPIGINTTDAWNVDFDNTVGVIPTFGITLGAVGTLAWVVFIALFVYLGTKYLLKVNVDKISRYLVASSLFSAAYFWAIAIFYVPNIVILGLAFITTGLFVGVLVSNGDVKNYNISFLKDPRVGFVTVLVLTVLIVLSLFVGDINITKFFSLRYFEAGTELATQGDVAGARQALESANSLRESDLVHRTLSQVEIGSLDVILNQQNLSQDTIKTEFQEASSAAIDNALKATQFDATNYLNWLSLAQAYKAMIPFGAGADFYDNAKKSFAQAQALNQNDPEIAFEGAQLELLNKNIPEAKADLVHALTLKNDYVDAILLYAQIQASEGNLAQAILSTQVATQISPNDTASFFQLGYLKYQNNDFAGAIPALERVVEFSPNYSNAKYFLGLSYSKIGRTADAIKEFEEIMAVNPGNTDVQTILKNLQTGSSLPTINSPIRKIKK